MKKKRLTGILALASCVALLTGCDSDAFFGLGGVWNKISETSVGLFNTVAEKLGFKEAEKKEEKEDEQKQDEGEQGGEQGGEEEQKIPSMVVSELPARLEVGEALDLTPYVTLENLEDFEVVVAEGSKELASAEGHVLSAKGEGEINFTIKAGELSESFSLEGFRGSREALINFFDGVENRYTAVVYQEEQTAGADTTEDETDDEYSWLTSDVLFHGKNYILSLGSWDADEQGNPIPGGFLRFGEDAEESYAYNLKTQGEGEEATEVVELGKQYSKVLLDYYNGDFSVDFSQAVYEYDEENDLDLYVITGNDASLFAENSLFVPNGAFGAQGQYPVDRVEFNIYDEAEEGEEESLAVDAYVYVSLSGESYLVEIATLYTDAESVGYALLDEYCVPENKPAGVDYWNYFHSSVGLGDFFLGADGLVGQTGLVKLDYGWFDDQGTAIECPAETEGTLFPYMPVGSNTMFFSETSIWEVSPILNEESGELEGYNPLSGRMLVAGEGENPDVVYDIFTTETGYFAEESDESGVWSNSSFTFADLAARENYAPGLISEATDITHMEAGENEGDPEQEVYDGTLFSFYQGKVGGLINALIAGCDGLYYLNAVISTYAQNGLDILPYFGGSLFINPSSGMVQVTVSFVWDDNQNWQVSFTSMPNSGVASLTGQFEANMLSSVIGQ